MISLEKAQQRLSQASGLCNMNSIHLHGPLSSSLSLFHLHVVAELMLSMPPRDFEFELIGSGF